MPVGHEIFRMSHAVTTSVCWLITQRTILCVHDCTHTELQQVDWRTDCGIGFPIRDKTKNMYGYVIEYRNFRIFVTCAIAL